MAPPTQQRDEDEKELAEMLPRLRAVASQCRSCIEGWPRLQALVSQWWEASLGEGVGLRVFGHAHDLFGPSPLQVGAAGAVGPGHAPWERSFLPLAGTLVTCYP